MEEYNLLISGFNEFLWIGFVCIILGALLYRWGKG